MSYQQFFEQISNLRVLVLGDLMLDRYLWGRVERISPEAPVPVVDVIKEESRPGGAANVALNLHALGAEAAICGVIGEDKAGEELRGLFQEKGFDDSLLLVDPKRKTTAKTRVIGNQQQMLRVDFEDRFPLESAMRYSLNDSLIPRIGEFDVVIFQDYDKGLLDKEIIAAVVKAAQAAGVPTVVDPKFRNFYDFSWTTLFKPNLKELNEGVGKRIEKTDLEGIREAVVALRKKMPHENTLVTLSEHGMVVYEEDLTWHHFPAHRRKIADVSGAGDTVISVIALALAGGLSLGAGTALANLAGGLVCEEVGVVPIDRDRLRNEAEIRLK